MGNKWDLEKSEPKMVSKCPCKKGGYYHVTNYYQDQYLNGKTKIEYYVSCSECDNTYSYQGKNNWIEKSIIQSIVNTYPIEERRDKLYKDLYTKYLNVFVASFKTQKSLYEFLKSEGKFGLPGTVETFRKHKISYYLSPYSSLHLEDFIKVICKKMEKEIEKEDINSIKEYLSMVQDRNKAIESNLITVN